MNFIPILSLLGLFFFYQMRNKFKLDVVSYLFIVYLIMALSSLVLEGSEFFPKAFNYSLESMLYLSLCFFIVFWGFAGYCGVDLKYIRIKNTKLFNLVEYLLIWGGVGAIVFFLPFAYKQMQGDIHANRVLVSDYAQVTLASYGIINSFFSLIANLFILSIFLSFINHNRGYSRKAFWLFVSSLSYVFYVLAYVGRDGVVYWIMSFIFVFLLMKDFLPERKRRKLRTLFAGLFLILMIPFAIISTARFGQTQEGVYWYFLEYMGQQIKSFSDAYQVGSPITYGHNTFPLYTKVLSNIGALPDGDEKINEYKHSFEELGVKPQVFKTYVGSFLISFGKLGTIAILLLLSILTRSIIKKIRRTDTLDLHDLILFVLLYQIPLWGVFYFRLYSANYYIIFMVILCLVFRFSKESSPVIIHSKTQL